MVVIYLKPYKEENLYRFHPWIFSGAIAQIKGKPEEGEVVRVVDSQGVFLAMGHYQVDSITVRVLSFSDENIDRLFFQNAIHKAYEMRQGIGVAGVENNTTYRLVHGEGDHLPGLVIDVYGDTAVMQAHSVGMHAVREVLASVVTEEIDTIKNVYYKSEGTLKSKGCIVAEDGYLIGKESACIPVENGLQFHADWLKGQKTGFFIDQRENRALLEKYSQNRDVLNMFCYTGGFSFYAMRGHARLVHSVDSSAKAIELTTKNVALNFPNDDRHHAFAADAFRFLETIDGKYDLIILDPPAFAKHRESLRNALKGYQKLNAKAFEQIKPGGILFTFSCSHVVTKDQFRLAVFSAAAQSKRKVRILHQLTQSADHPVNIYHPEGEYLKGLVLYVE